MLILTAMALIPPLVLMAYVYRADKVEKEPISLIAKAFIFGGIAVVPILIVELLLDPVIKMIFPARPILYLLAENFLGVALVEEFFKLFACKRAVYDSREFDYTFDGIVYAVAASLGFAAIENIQYVFTMGGAVAVSRAFTAIPGHAIFGVFMGVYLGIAKYEEYHGSEKVSSIYMKLALVVPVLIHGFYDFILSVRTPVAILIFYIFLIAMDMLAIRKVKEMGRKDLRI